jgi:hypothetical protein
MVLSLVFTVNKRFDFNSFVFIPIVHDIPLQIVPQHHCLDNDTTQVSQNENAILDHFQRKRA